MSEYEVWKDVPDYEGLYKVSNTGNIWSCKHRKVLSKRTIKGYACINLHKNGVQKTFSIHRLVALAYIPNPLKKAEVNHIDEDKSNNDVTNLEWVTPKENSNYGTRNERISEYVKTHPRRNLRKVAQIDKRTGDILAIYNSVSEAAKKNCFHQGNICWCCHGKKNEANGYKWKFIEEVPLKSA